LHVDGVGLLGIQSQVLHRVLKAGGLGGQGEVIRRQGVEVEDAAGVRGRSAGVICIRIRKRQRGPGYQRSAGVGDCALNGSAELRMCCAGNQKYCR
jgi:hypothetical protein